MKEQITPVRILGISGSLRGASFSTSLIRLLAQRAGAEIVISLAEIGDIPLYNERSRWRREAARRGKTQSGDCRQRWSPDCHSRIQSRYSWRSQERSRLGVSAGPQLYTEKQTSFDYLVFARVYRRCTSTISASRDVDCDAGLCSSWTGSRGRRGSLQVHERLVHKRIYPQFHDGITRPSSLRDPCPLIAFAGHMLQERTKVSSGAALVHIAWLALACYFEAWYGARVVPSAARVDARGPGVGHGIGDLTIGPPRRIRMKAIR